MSDVYNSISKISKGSYREKASKFIAFAFPVSTEEEIRTKLQMLRKEYHDANHHCFAYRLDQQGSVYRANDDGEPSGSAGKQILGQLISMNLSDVLVVVVRYFGGTKLGIPGLINAYRVATRLALEDATIIQKQTEVRYQVKFCFSDLDRILKLLKNSQVTIHEKKIDQECTLTIFIRESLRESITDRLKKIAGTIIIQQEH